MKHLFTARAEARNVLVSCIGGVSCRVLGTTIPVSVAIRKDTASFTAHLPEGAANGLVALAMSGAQNWIGVVLVVTADEGGRAHADLDNAWVPDGRQLVHVDGNGVFVTDVGFGDRFTTSPYDAKDEWMHVPDGNLLMRFVAGTATIHDVRTAAQANVEEQSAREQLAEIEPKMQRVEADLAEVGTTVEALGPEYRRLQEIEHWGRILRDVLHLNPTHLPDVVDLAIGRLYKALLVPKAGTSTEGPLG